MYLEFSNITRYHDINRKIKNQGYGRYGISHDDIAGLKLQLFTVSKAAAEESKINLVQILDIAGKFEIPTVIVKPQLIQFIGHGMLISQDLILDEAGIQRFSDADIVSRWAKGPRWRGEASNKGYYMLELGGYFSTEWALSPQCGYYQLNHSGTDYNKITNRQTQIQQLWDWGWPARRGRPVHIGFEQHSGNCEEIEYLTDMAAQLQYRRRHSEVAKRAVANYRAINKEYAWPNNW